MSTFDKGEGLESRKKYRSHGASSSRAALESTAFEEVKPTIAACEQTRALTTHLMERIVHRDNLNQAYLRVKRNKGSAGIDGMSVDDLSCWIKLHKKVLIESLLNGSYKPQAVRRVEIPKASGGMRQLGIPTVVDRLVQQAILQVLDPILDPSFSKHSYGFRPRRSAHQAVLQAREYVRDGRWIVVDMDLEKFFDRVNHDILMSRLARRISDKRLLRITRRFLQSGVMAAGVEQPSYEGTPQGGPLSPLLANLLLDDLDKELERRGHCFCRYADDCNIYVKTKQAGYRVLVSISHFLESKLKLKVNRSKSAVAFIEERKFLGYRLLKRGRLGIAPESLVRAKQRIRQIVSRSRGRSLEEVTKQINTFVVGWVNYYRYAQASYILRTLDEWIRRKLRCYRLKQRKRKYSIVRWLMQLGVPENRAWLAGGSSRGWWKLSSAPPVKEAMSNKWFEELGLVSLKQRWETLQLR